MPHPIAVLLHNVRSAHNVGAIFRTADAAGVAKIFITGYTPAPLDRFNRPQKEISKTALGAESYVPWKQYTAATHPLEGLKEKGFTIVGVEQDPRAIAYDSYRVTGPTVFVFGNEVQGLSPALRAKCDTLVYIPMFGKKESLNVATTAGIILFEARRSRIN